MATLYLSEQNTYQEKPVNLDELMERLYPFKPVYARETLTTNAPSPVQPINAVFLKIETTEVDHFLFEKSGIYLLQDQSSKTINLDTF